MSTLRLNTIQNPSGTTAMTINEDTGAASFPAGLTGGGKLLNIGFSHYTSVLALTSSFQTINTVTMTPASASSKFICLVTASFYHESATTVCVTELARNSSQLYEVADWWNPSGTGLPGNAALNYVDQPNTTSSVTWTQGVKEDVGAGKTNADYNGTTNGVCTLIVMEIA